ncbi:hypothetical protein ACQ5AI_29235, partial [Klebsiella michiganensis]
SAQIREILISESAWEEMTCLFAPSLDELKTQFALSYLFISHDLAVVESIADRVAVLYLGELLECRETRQLFESPQHEYTQNLMSSAPRIHIEPSNETC